MRVSTEEQAKYGLSLDFQKERIAEFCKARGWELVKIFEDAGESGAKPLFERPGFRQAIEFCRKENIHFLVVYRLDRLTRQDVDKVMPILEKLNLEYNILVIPISEFEIVFHSDLALYESFIRLYVQLAAYERELKRLRTKEAMRDLKRRGKIKSVLEKIPKEVQDLICSLYKEGKSIRQIYEYFKSLKEKGLFRLSISRYAIERILVARGLLQRPIDVCPRCFHRMKIKSAYPKIRYYCENCGFERIVDKLSGEIIEY